MWGRGYKPFSDKLIPLSEYYFTISVMNCKIDNYFTEILVDNLMTGTVPIFWGCPNINEYFDEKGIITFDTIEELDQILSTLSVENYMSMMNHIKNNLNLAKKYVSTDDIIADILEKIKY